MSLHLDFEPHGWYMGFAIRDQRLSHFEADGKWYAVTANGMTGYLVEFEAETLDGLRKQIRDYHLKQHNGYGERLAKRRLAHLRGELSAERISYGELAELQSLADYIEPGDVELLEAAAVPESEA